MRIFGRCTLIVLMLVFWAIATPLLAEDVLSVSPPPVNSPAVSEMDASVSPTASLNSPAITPPSPLSTLVKINYQQIPFEQVVADLATQAKMMIKVDPTVKGTITLSLGEVPLSVALDALAVITETYWGYTADGVIVIAPPDPKGPYFKDIAVVETIKINHLTVDEVMAALSTHPYAGYAKSTTTTNSLTVIAPPAIIARLRADIAIIDKPMPLIETQVVVLDTSQVGNRNFSLNMEYSRGPRNPSGVRTIQLANMILGYTDNLAGQILTTLVDRFSRDKLEIMAQPKLTARDNEEATCFFGKKNYIPTFTSYGTTAPPATVTVIESGIRLKVRARVVENDYILITIDPEVSEVVGTGSYGVPVINTRTISSTLLVKNGETIIAGGLVTKLAYRFRERIPLLSWIPIIGNLFATSHSETRIQEITILITPRIVVRPEEEPKVGEAKGVVEERTPEPVVPRGPVEPETNPVPAPAPAPNPASSQ